MTYGRTKINFYLDKKMELKSYLKVNGAAFMEFCDGVLRQEGKKFLTGAWEKLKTSWWEK